MNDFSKYEQQRKAVYAKVKLFFASSAILASIAIIFIIWLTSSEKQGVFLPLIIVFFLSSVILLAVGLSIKGKFFQMIKTELVAKYFEQKYPNLRYSPKNGLPQSLVTSGGLLKRPDRYSSEDLVEGDYKGVRFQVSDCTLEDESTDSEGNTTYHTYFSGRYFVYEFKRRFSDILRICEKFDFVDKKNLIKVETESIKFTKKFKIFASSVQFAFYILTPTTIEKLTALEEKYKGKISFYLHDCEFHVAINDNKNYMEIKLRNEISEKTYETFDEDIQVIFSIIDDFNLASDRFNVNIK